MQTIRWFRWLALGVMAVPVVARAQGPQPIIKEIATIPGVDVDEAVRMPNGHVIIYTTGDSIAAYDVTSKRRTLITRGYDEELAVSAQGDRLAYIRQTEDGKASYIWTMPINPTTGTPAGSPQRVTTTDSDEPSFSPDGRMIAFAAGALANPRRATHGPELAVVPVNGGPARTLASYQRQIGGTSWSADGKWVYVQVGAVPDTSRSIERVPAGGGKSEHLISYLHPQNSEGSIDGQIAFFRADAGARLNGRIAYATASGVHGQIDLPAGASPGTWLNTSRNLLTKTITPNLLHLLNIKDGTIRDLPVRGIDARNVAWSNDRTHLALVTGERPNLELVIMKVDGTDQHRFQYNGGYGLQLSTMAPSWSPDGTNIVYTANGGSELRVLNVATGASRTIASVTAPSRIGGQILWRPDGKSFVTKTARSSDGAVSGQAIVEVRLDGTQSLLRNLWASFPRVRAVSLASTRYAVVELADSLGGPLTHFVVASLDGGADRAVTTPPLPPGTRLGYIFAQSEKTFVALLDESGRATGVQVMSTEGDSTHVLPLPASGSFWAGGPNFILPDGEHLLKIGGDASSDREYTLYSIPFDGTAPRAVGHLPTSLVGTSGWSSGLSANGNLIAFFSAGTPTTHIYDIDLTPVLQSVIKH